MSATWAGGGAPDPKIWGLKCSIFYFTLSFPTFLHVHATHIFLYNLQNLRKLVSLRLRSSIQYFVYINIYRLVSVAHWHSAR